MNKHNELIKKCELLLYAISDKEIVVPVKDLNLYMNIQNHKEECIDNMLELLDKETPVKPVKKQYKYSHHLHCGKCDERFCVVRYDDIKNDIVYKHKLSYKKCPECFQKVDWSD